MLDAISALDYRPNGLARALVARRPVARKDAEEDRPRLLTVGYLSVDYVISVPSVPTPGSRTSSRTILKVPGGPAANVAVFAANVGAPLSLDVDLVSCIASDDDSRWAVAALAERGVDAGGSATSPDRNLSRCVVLVDDGGQRTIINEPSPLSTEQIERHVIDAVGKGDVTVHFDGFHLDVALALAPRLRSAGCRLTVHSVGIRDGVASLRQLTESFDIVFVSDDDLPTLLVSTPEAFDEALATLTEGPCDGVVVTRGSRHATLHRPGHPPLDFLPPNVEVIDRTGAGDAFVGVFLASWLCTNDLAAALGHAVRGASLSVTAVGAQGRLISWADLEYPTESLREGA